MTDATSADSESGQAAQLASAVLFERDDHLLVVHRKPGRPPFAEQWLVPMTPVRDEETAEEALRRYGPDQFGVSLGVEQFIDTVYAEDPQGGARYVVNIFRAPMEGGPAHFNADGDYDDARWCVAGEIERLWMPPSLRDALVRIMVEGVPPPVVDWSTPAGREATPLAEREADAGPPPDNRASWDTISEAYQEQCYGERYGERLMWSWSNSEEDLHLLDEVRGKHVLVLGCGGGQDCVALEKLGAIVVGIDQSAKQIEYARKYAARHDAPNASFVEGTVEDLSRFDDESFDMAVSAHMLNYVERIEDTLREAARVLKPGGAFSISVRHPFDAALAERPPYGVVRAYWSEQDDWTWSLEGGVSARFRQWYWPVSRWFEMLTDAGFVVERMLEPQEGPLDAAGAGRERLVPHTLYVKARKR
ncbi:MAG: methyltransferase domain-containing protein [Dehalococcoidia bacterium]|nr:MAG: methyltransferase domain-containing protein [Dehalococcoidia bacterium]